MNNDGAFAFDRCPTSFDWNGGIGLVAALGLQLISKNLPLEINQSSA